MFSNLLKIILISVLQQLYLISFRHNFVRRDGNLKKFQALCNDRQNFTCVIKYFTVATVFLFYCDAKYSHILPVFYHVRCYLFGLFSSSHFSFFWFHASFLENLFVKKKISNFKFPISFDRKIDFPH